MRVLDVKNVAEALPKALQLLNREGVRRDSRNGPVIMSPVPVSTVYRYPQERVLLYSWRDANPFFHLYESLWMLAGRRDVAPITRFVSRFKEYSDDGKTFNAAYGWRWRVMNGDQLSAIVDNLRKNRDDRRQVLQIWDSDKDLAWTKEKYVGKDAACNLTATFQIGADDKLHMVVFCRSNDVIWGCYGANAVHFSILLEYVAAGVGVRVGTYTQVSVNWHAYEDKLKQLVLARAREPVQTHAPYRFGLVRVTPVVNTEKNSWDEDCRWFVTNSGTVAGLQRDHFADPFFKNVAFPIVQAHDAFRDLSGEARYTEPLRILRDCEGLDWQVACEQWIQRRYDHWKFKREHP